jgi:hypothetical protein
MADLISKNKIKTKKKSFIETATVRASHITQYFWHYLKFEKLDCFIKFIIQRKLLI